LFELLHTHDTDISRVYFHNKMLIYVFSGQQILGPSKKSSNKIVKDMFKAAKE